MRQILIFSLCLLSLGLSTDADAKRKKKKRKGPLPAGWVDGEEGQPACYNPPNWDEFTTIDRKMMRSEVMDEMLGQWKGNRSDGVSFSEVTIDKVDTVLLGRPDRVEEVSAENFSLCQAGNRVAWEEWAARLPGKLTAGECNTPFDYTLFDHVNIDTGWQRNRPICKGNKVMIRASIKDLYKIKDDGPWITVAGDPAMPTTGSSDWPCNIEDCMAGILILRFNGESGQSSIYVVGPELIFTAPEHGSIEYRINDTEFFDNKWREQGGIVDHASIEISPTR